MTSSVIVQLLIHHRPPLLLIWTQTYNGGSCQWLIWVQMLFFPAFSAAVVNNLWRKLLIHSLLFLSFMLTWRITLMVLYNSWMLLLRWLRKLRSPYAKTSSNVIFEILITLSDWSRIVLVKILLSYRFSENFFFFVTQRPLLDIVSLTLLLIIFDLIIIELVVGVENLKMIICCGKQLSMAGTTWMT